MSGAHRRVTAPMQTSLRCGARTRKGAPCLSPAVCGRARCRMHGGAPGSGAPRGNQNAVTHGFYTADAKAERQGLEALLRRSGEQLADFEKDALGGE